MKIAYIGQKGIPTLYGGVERHVEGLATKMAESGHQVFVYTRSYYTPKDLKNFQGVNLINLPSIRTKHFDAISHSFLATIHALFKKYDVIHYHGVGPSILAFIPKIFKPYTKVVVTFHCVDRKHEKWGGFAKRILSLGEWTSCNFPHQTIAVSKEIQKYCLEKFKTQVNYIPNGVTVNYGNLKNNELDKFNLEPQKYFVIVSRLIPHKNIEEVIKVSKNLDNYKLAIVGDGFYTDDYVNYLKDLAKDSENIIFTGNQTGDALEQLFQNALAFILPSKNEGLSISLLEAMSYKLPIIVRDIPEHQDLVSEKLMLSYNSPEELRGMIESIITSPKQYKNMGLKAYDYVKDNFSWERIGKETDYLYNKLFTGPGFVSLFRKLFGWIKP